MVPQRTLAAAMHAAVQLCREAKLACDDAELMGRVADAARERAWLNRHAVAVQRQAALDQVGGGQPSPAVV